MRRATAALVGLLLLAVPGVSRGSDVASSTYLPASVLVRPERALVYRGPDKHGSRRGTVVGGQRLPAYRTTSGPGCSSLWVEVYAEGWVCGTDLLASPLPPDAVALPELPAGQITPYPCAFAREEGAPIFARLSDAAIDYAERWLDGGFAVAVRRKVYYEGQRFYRSAGGLYVRASDVYLARPSMFHGEELQGRELLGWTFRQSTRVYDGLPGRGHVSFTSVDRQVVFRLAAEHEVGGVIYLQSTDGRYVRASDLRQPAYLDPPEPVGPYDVWFDVDTAQQVLVAYRGAEPIFATLISSGRRGHATPRGTYRIWVKLITGRMANEEPSDPDEKPYYLEDVPWVMYFNDDIALHGAYWHRSFGHVRSHGCVNLAPLDARWVFDRAQPALPRGWWSVLPSSDDPGSFVRVR
ncbi:MAG: L,D-transpeptidase [Deltaproteobacteria bacterium]|nr:L,D-transpeptidase [Deltaproteobacteria bacterium]